MINKTRQYLLKTKIYLLKKLCKFVCWLELNSINLIFLLRLFNNFNSPCGQFPKGCTFIPVFIGIQPQPGKTYKRDIPPYRSYRSLGIGRIIHSRSTDQVIRDISVHLYLSLARLKLYPSEHRDKDVTYQKSSAY